MNTNLKVGNDYFPNIKDNYKSVSSGFTFSGWNQDPPPQYTVIFLVSSLA